MSIATSPRFAEKNQRVAGWMNGTIASDQQIGIQQVFVKLQRLLTVSGAGFFFALQDEFRFTDSGIFFAWSPSMAARMA